jgi:hypothetical protein
MNDVTVPNAGAGILEQEENLNASQWQAKYQQIALERDCLRQQLNEVTRERDDYLQAVYALLPTPELPCSEEELFAQRGANPTIHQLLAELE